MGGIFMKNKIAILLIIVVTIVCCPVLVLADSNVSDGCVYSILPGTQEWVSLGTVEAKTAACRIPEEKLLSMNDEELLKAVIDYPFLIDIFLCDDFSIPVHGLLERCDALRELSRRHDASNVLMDFLKENYDKDNRIVSDIEEFKLEAIMIILSYDDNFCNELSRNDIEFINSQSHLVRIKEDNNGLRIAYVYTPNGSQVICNTYSCSHSDPYFHSDLDDYAVSVYDVSLISGGSCRYNCHSYTWYYTSTSNTLWIDNPSVYMTDGSYDLVMSNMYNSSSSVYSGDHICYGSKYSPAHSAVVTSASSSTALCNRYVKSKWGIAGVFSHTVSNVPDDYWDSGYYASAWTLS